MNPFKMSFLQALDAISKSECPALVFVRGNADGRTLAEFLSDARYAATADELVDLVPRFELREFRTLVVDVHRAHGWSAPHVELIVFLTNVNPPTYHQCVARVVRVGRREGAPLEILQATME